MTSDELPATGQEVRLAEHPDGALTLSCFELAETKVPTPGEGEVLVRHQYLQLAAVTGDLMRPEPNLPMPGFRIGEPLTGLTVGVVLRSRSTQLEPGDLVRTADGFREFSSGPAERYVKLSAEALPRPVHHLLQGPTAYHGMVDIAEVGEGDTVYVSGAAGGVGSLAGQIAKCRGAERVIGAAGSKAKTEWMVDELGYDAAFDYHDGPLQDRLRELAPDGIDVFFDNVGGEQFEAAVAAAAPHARFALCGALSGQVGDSAGAFPRLDVMTAIRKQITIRPFATYHTPDQIEAWNSHFRQWTAEGRFVVPQTVVEGGLSAAPQALIGLLSGAYAGNVAVRLT